MEPKINDKCPNLIVECEKRNTDNNGWKTKKCKRKKMKRMKTIKKK